MVRCLARTGMTEQPPVSGKARGSRASALPSSPSPTGRNDREVKPSPGGHQRQLSTVTVVILGVALALMGNLATNTVQVTWRWWPYVAWAAVSLLTLAAVINELAGLRADTHRSQSEGLEAIAEDLAKVVEHQWKQEAALRQVNQPNPLQVRWSSTNRLVAASPDVVFDDPPAAASVQLPLAGAVSEIASAFRSLPHQQLVILGEAGAGKSVLAMLLTLGLIKDREPSRPFPVLLSIASWDPTKETALGFIARRLGEEYEFLARRSVDARSSAELLVDRGYVLPVLDGLDELLTQWQSQAVESLDLFAAMGHPLVITCRSSEYEQAVARGGAILSRAAVIEIEPVNVEQAIEFLRDPAPARSNWQPVFEHLRADPRGPLAQVLSTPLMVTLARAAYRSPAGRPADLLRFPDRASLAGSLIDGFVRSVYQADQPDGSPSQGHRVRHYRPEHAERWLGCLAYHLDTIHTRDLWWWRLRSDLLSPRPWVTRAVIPVLLLSAAAVGGICLGVVIGPWSPIWAAVAAAAVVATAGVGVFRSMWPGGYPPYVTPWYRTSKQRRRHSLGVRAAFGIFCGLMTGLVIHAFLLGLVGGLACGIVAIFMPTMSASLHVRRPNPRATLHANHRSIITAAAQYGLTGGIVFALLARLFAESPDALTAGCTAAAVYALGAAAGSGLWTWSQLWIAHVLLAARGWLPWRLWAFLEDARYRGILRQAGTVFQFRHALLQDHLAQETRIKYWHIRADTGSRYASPRLAQVLAAQGRIVELRARADAGDPSAAIQMASMLVMQGRTQDAINVIQVRPDGDRWPSSAGQLACLLAMQGRNDEANAILRACADADEVAARQLAGLLAGHGHINEAATILGTHARKDIRSTQQLARMLTAHGQIDDAIAALRAKGKDIRTLGPLVQLLEMQGRIDEAITMLRGYPVATPELASMLARYGHIDELQSRADSGDGYAARRLAHLLAHQGRIDEATAILRPSAGRRAAYFTSSPDAAKQLAHLLARHGRIDEAIKFLQARANAGDGQASSQLAGLLARHGRIDEAIAILQARVTRIRARSDRGHAVERLANLLALQGRVDEALAILRSHAESPHVFETDNTERASRQLAHLLARHQRIDELLSRASGGDRDAAVQLAKVYARQGRVDAAIPILQATAIFGHLDDRGAKLANLLAAQGLAAEALAILQALAVIGDWDAIQRLLAS